MPVSAPTSASAATQRQLKAIVVVLILSNIAVGVFSMLALRQADARYSELLDHSVPVLNDLQTLTAKASEVMITSNVTRLTSAHDQNPIARAETALKLDATVRDHVLSEVWVTADNPERREMKVAGDQFTAAASKVVALVQQGDVSAAAQQRDTQVVPAFRRYLDAITIAADVLQAESQRRNDLESDRMSKVSTLVLGIASWPVLVVMILLLLTAVFVLVLMVLFRGREMSDMP